MSKPDLPSATHGPFTVEVFRSADGRVFANVSQGNVQLAHLKAGESFTSTEEPRSEIAPKSSTSWRDQVEGATWDENHSGHYILARDMAAILDRQALPSATREKIDHDICRTCGLFVRGHDVQGDACPGHPVKVKSEDAALLEMCHGALSELISRIERCGASPELTQAVTLCSDLMLSVGNRWNPPDKYAQQRVRVELCRAIEKAGK